MQPARKPLDKAPQTTKPVQQETTPDVVAPAPAPNLRLLEQRLDSRTILQLQRTVGNRGTQELLRLHSPKPKVQREQQASKEQEGEQDLQLQAGESEVVNGQLSSKILAMPGAIQRKDEQGNTETLVPMADGSYVGFQQVEQPAPREPMPISSVQRTAAALSTPMTVSSAANGDIQRFDKAKVGKRIGYGVANFFSEALIGPLTDLKHLVRVIHYNVQKDPNKDTKTDKIKERVKEEWVGEYPGARWMNVFHAIGTTAEKLAALAGVITLIATIASIWMGAAAPIATVAGLVGLSLASIAFLVRALLSSVSLYKFKKTGDAAFKKMAIVNLVQGIGNALAIVSFGVGTHLGGGVSMDATTKGSAQFGKELGAGLAFSVGTKAATISNDIVQSKPNSLQRDPGGGGMSPQALELADVLEQADGVIPEQKRQAAESKADVSTNQTALNAANAKTNEMLGKTEESKTQGNQMNSAAEQTEAEAEQPSEDMADDVSAEEVGEMEEQLTVGEAKADNETAESSEAPKTKKKGMWTTIKEKAKATGKAIKKGLSAFFGRIMGVWRRFKALAAKLKAKVVAFMLRITGLDKDVKEGQALIQQDLASQPAELQSANEYGASVETLDNTMKEYR
jgi:hypothetical protein